MAQGIQAQSRHPGSLVPFPPSRGAVGNRGAGACKGPGPRAGALGHRGPLTPPPPAYLAPPAPLQLPCLGLATMSPAPHRLRPTHGLCSPKALPLCSLWHRWALNTSKMRGWLSPDPQQVPGRGVSWGNGGLLQDWGWRADFQGLWLALHP